MVTKGSGESVASAVDNDDTENKMDSDTIDVPVGKFLGKLRGNPWMIATIAVVLILLFMFLFGLGGVTGGVTGRVVDVDVAASNLVDFINAQGQEVATYVSGERDGTLYRIVVRLSGQDIPIYMTLDGKYLIRDIVEIRASETEGTTERVEVDISGAPFKGEPDAPVTIVEFTDYQCPFCGKHFTDTYPLIEKNYVATGKVKYVVMDFPLTNIHPEALKAAEAARCVGEVAGPVAYFDMHDILFRNQQSLSESNYKLWAREIPEVDGIKFDDCLDSDKYETVVLADQAYGQSIGVTGTPASFVNGQLVSGAVPYAQFEALIEAELAA